MESPAIEKSRKEIQDTLRSLAIESSMPVVDEWREVLRVVGKCKTLKEAIGMIQECVLMSEEACDRIERPKNAGKWIAICLRKRIDVERQINIINQENAQREYDANQEQIRRKELIESCGKRYEEADVLIPALMKTGDELAIKWAEMAKKAATHFILSNCRRVLRDVRKQQELGRQMQ
jgi:hypothetical protein